ncbi:ABC transporter substrate-binding protein [Serratia marcescens]|uniref:ABC transporter substrate-binding protein n=1 Tax=Serratia marcescens TaxID=615 RepID=UPI0030CBD150
MKAKLLPLFLLAALPATALAATPPNTLVVVQSLDDIVSLDPAEANELSSIQTVPSLYQRLVQADREDPAKVAPVLAESWQSDAAAKTLTVKLRPQAALANVKDGDFGNAWLKMHSAGSGPFKMRVYQPHQAIVLDANPTTPGDKPQLKNIIIKNVPDPATRRLLIQQGDADIARELGADQTDTLKNQPGVKVLEIPSAEQNYLVFNAGNGANPLLNNPAFWEAARYLVDYQGITKDLLKGQYFVHQSFLPVGLPGALETNPFSYDPAKAKAILAKAGITHAAFTLDVENKPPFITIAQALQGSFAAAGVKVELLPAAGSQVYSRVRARQHQAAIRLWIPDYFDAHSNASAFAYNDGKSSTVAGLNGWQIPQLNQQTLAALAEADPAKRRALYTAMQQELQRSSPYVFIDQAKTEVVLRDNVKGYQQGLNADMVYYDRVSK